ncbi:hypothetical protein [Terriglobus albidus]|uniref:hypothetical protein n=1 Tax=Terriglobus albidus TaxID=1592106 RepID=UPI0021DFFBEA|nr:hypothetical protein [Terriglobus albidus]
MNLNENRTRHLLVLLAILSLAPISSQAWNQSRESQSQSKESQEKDRKMMTITGCLEKGDEADEFAITQDGKKYGLRSTTVKLSDHLGHKVTVMGRMTKAEKGEKEEAGGGETADVQVTSLKMISTSCQ